jgi:hypothetical protein
VVEVVPDARRQARRQAQRQGRAAIQRYRYTEICLSGGHTPALYNLADAHIFLNEIDRGMELCHQALAINRQIGNRRGEAHEILSEWQKGKLSDEPTSE